MCQFDCTALHLGCPLGRQEVSGGTRPITGLGEVQKDMELRQTHNPEVEHEFDKDLLPKRGQASDPGQNALQVSLGLVHITLKDVFNLSERQAVVGEIVPNPNGDFPNGINVGLEIGLAADALVAGDPLFEGFSHLPMIAGQRQIREAKEVNQVEDHTDHNDHPDEQENRGVHWDALNKVEDDANKHEAENESNHKIISFIRVILRFHERVNPTHDARCGTNGGYDTHNDGGTQTDSRLFALTL